MSGPTVSPGGELTHKETLFVSNLVSNGGNVTKAALAAYDVCSPKSASSLGSTTLAKPRVRSAFESACRRKGFGVDNVVNVIVDASVANSVHYSQSGEQFEHPDHRTRLASAALAAKLLNLEPKTGKDRQGARHLHLHGLSDDELEARLIGKVPASDNK